MMLEAEAIQLLVMVAPGFLPHLTPRAIRHLPQTGIQLVNADGGWTLHHS